MPVPSTPSFAQIPNTLNELLNIQKNYFRGFSEGLTNTTKATKLNRIRSLATEKKVIANQKAVKAAKVVTDNLKKGSFKKVNNNLGLAIGFALQLASLGLNFLTINHIGKLQETQIKIDGIQNRDLGAAFTRAINNTLNLRKLRQDFQSFITQYKDDKDKLFAEAGASQASAAEARENSEKARKMANDALYETRAGRTKIEAKITNVNNLFNQLSTQVGIQNKELARRINDAYKQADNAYKKANDTLYEARVNLQRLSAQIKSQSSASNINSMFTSLRNDFNRQIRQIKSENQSQVNRLFQQSQNIIYNALKKAESAQKEARISQNNATRLRSDLTSLQKKVNNLDLDSYIENVIREVIKNNPQIRGLEKILNKHNIRIKGLETAFPTLTKNVSATLTKIKIVDGKVTQLEKNGIKVQGLNGVNTRINIVDSKINASNTEIKKLGQKLKDREAVDKNASIKLDRLLNLVAPLPLVIGRVPDQTAKKIPRPLNQGQIQAATAAGVCKSTGPGGCMNKILGDTVDRINQNTNNWGKNLLDKINTGANAAQLALLSKIDGKLGKQIVGGISGQVFKNFERVNEFAEWLHLDRILHVMNWINTTHNGAMLSTDLVRSLFSGVDNVAGIFFQDIDGVDINTGAAVSSFFDNAAKRVFGVTNWENTKTQFKLYNRIYQSTQNVLNNVTSMFDSTYSALEVVGNRVSMIGNALRWFGILSDKAFGWMNENNNFSNPLIVKITKAKEAADAVEQVSSDVLSAFENGKELLKNTKEFKEGITKLSESETKKEDKERSGLKVPEVEEADVA